MTLRLVLASTSASRAAVLREASIDFEAFAPSVDERSFDHRFPELGPAGYVLEIARAKAESVVARLQAERVGAGTPTQDRRTVVVGCDQVAVLTVDGRPELLHKPETPQRAVEQLMRMSGGTHELVNGVVAIEVESATVRHEIDRHRITMRDFSRSEAEDYVERFAPLDCAGSYRIEDDADLLLSVEGEHRTGVIGLPLPTLLRLLDAATNGHEK